jgi:predicted phage terminase large subunit-like protein
MTRIKLPPLHQGQEQVWTSRARFKVLAAGRRWGKSRLGAALCLTELLEDRRAWWVSPTYPIAEIGWRSIKELARQIPGIVIREGDRQAAYGNGFIQVKSADNSTGLRGEGLDLLIVDEAAHIRNWPEVWEQALRPSLSDRKGRALFISTPKGFNHFFELYQRGDKGGEWASFHFPSESNPFLDPAEIEAARRDLPALVAKQEYDAEFVQLVGALFKREYFTIIEDAPDIQYARFYDLAASTRTSADYTAGAKVGLDRDGTLIIADIVRGRWEWPDALKVIVNTARSDGVGVEQGIEDVGTQKGMYQTIMRDPLAVGLSFRPIVPRGDKVVRANPWLARAEQGKLALVRGAWNASLINEACSFPEADHDDMIDAVSGAVSMLGNQYAPSAYAWLAK